MNIGIRGSADRPSPGDRIRHSTGMDPALRRQDDGPGRPIAFGLRRAFLALGLSSSAYAFLAAWAFLLSRMGFSDAACLSVVHVASAAGLLTFWRLGRWGRARYDCFGAALLLLAVALRLQALMDTLVYGTRVDIIYLYPNVPMPADVFLLFLKAETITTIGILLAAFTWRLHIGIHVEAHSFLRNVRSVPAQTPIIVYLAALVVDVLIRVLGVSFGALTMFSTSLFMLGVASIYFIAARRPSRIGRIALAVLMGLAMALLALNKGMKSEMFFPLVPAAILFWTAYRNALLRAAFVGLAVTVLALSQLYVHHVRQVAWHSEGIERMSPIVLMVGFLAELPTFDLRDAWNSASSRLNMTVAHATTVTLADSNGFEPINVFGPIPGTFVPRFLWPGKPVLQPGAQHTARILGTHVPVSEIRSATAAGFSTELYLGGWWAGAVLGMLAYGFLLASAQRWALRTSPGFGHLAFCFLAFYWAFRFDEHHVVYSYTAIAFMVAFLWALRLAAGALGLKSIAMSRAGS